METQNAIKKFNIPVDYMKQSMDNPFHRQLLAFWACIKMKSGDSLYHPTISGIMRDFKCGHETAKRLYEHVTTVGDRSLLFKYNPYTNGLVARSWKLNPATKKIRFAKDGMAKMKYCAKVTRPEILSINGMIREMRKALMKVPMDEMQRSDKFLSGSEKYSSCSDRSLALNQKKLGRIINAHRSTVSRLIKQMENDGIVEVSRKALQPVYDDKHGVWLVKEDEVKKYGLEKRHRIINRYTGIASVRDANEYFPKERTSFNVIINAHNRVGKCFSFTSTNKHKDNVSYDDPRAYYIYR